tara:strand:+ start:841 stop:2070 length:1230 start_codon:yes stop_codon:yes gene_type:complete
MSKYQGSKQPLIIQLKELVNRYLPNVHVDKTFQRRVCWSLEQKQSFIVNLLKQYDSGTFSFADVQSGLDRSNNDAHASSTKKYEKVKSLGKAFVSLDGQNRGVATQEFYSDDFGITAKIFIDGLEFDLDDCKYSKLPIEIKALLDTAQMVVVVFNSFLYGDLSQIFVDVNGGLPMVSQEKRNSIDTWISTELLNKAESKYRQILERVVKPEDILRMGEVELLLKVLVATHQQFKWTSTNSKTLDQFYKLGLSKTRNKVPNYHDAHMQRFYRIMEFVSQFLNAPKHKNLQKKSGGLPNQMFWAAVIVSEYLVDNALTFTSNHGKDLDVLVYELDRRLQHRGEQDRAAAIQLFQSGKGPEPSRKDYYDAWVNLPHQKQALMKRKDELTREFHECCSGILQTNLVTLSKVAV